jgi:hypothetical protein
MGFLDKIKDIAGKSALRKSSRLNQRKRATFNFETAKTAGVVLYTKDAACFKATQDFVKFLKEKKIDTWSIGYADSDEVINAYSYQIGMNHFTKKNLNWYKKPVCPHTEQFVNKEFDILFDLCLDDFYPVQYIVGMSRAKFKVGSYMTEESFHDLIIDVNKNKNIEYLIEQIKHYITLIKQ